MATHEHAHGYKQYFTTWCWLLAMTLLALGIGYIEQLPYVVKAGLLVGITLAKIYLIGSIFMHLKTERVNLVMCTFSPLVLSIVMFFFTFGETRETESHKRENVSVNFVMPKGHHAEGGAEKAEEHAPEPK